MPTISPGGQRRAFCRSSSPSQGSRATRSRSETARVLSLSVWDTRADAESGNEVVASWVAENMARDIDVINVRYAEIKFSTTLGVSTVGAAV